MRFPYSNTKAEAEAALTAKKISPGGPGSDYEGVALMMMSTFD